MKLGQITPWGAADLVTEVAPGIVAVSTSSHGGIILSQGRHQQLKARFRSFETFVGGTAYEEDCDASAVILAFWEHYPHAAIRAADIMARVNFLQRELKWRDVVRCLDDEDSEWAYRIRNVIEGFEADHADHWWRRGMWSTSTEYDRGCWGVGLTRVRDGERRDVILSEYPDQEYYTDAELDAKAAKKMEVATP